MPTMRINQALAAAGVASRRKAEELIRAGRVRLNGQVVKVLATQVDPQRDKLTLDGKPLTLARHAYYAYHKPRGLIATLKDESDRPCLGTVCRALEGSPRPVGRLDRASEGLMLLTNNGELANRVTHPRFGVRKQYQVTVEPRLAERDVRQALRGVALDDGPARFLALSVESEDPERSWILVTVNEGRNRLIRRLFEELGYAVKRLKRVRLGSLQLGKLPCGKSRLLTPAEIAELKKLVGM